MKNLKYILALLGFFAIIVGAGCAIGMNFAANNWFAGICCVVLTIAAVPTAVRLFKFLRS